MLFNWLLCGNLAAGPDKDRPFALIFACTIFTDDKALFRPAVKLGRCAYTAIVNPDVVSRLIVDQDIFLDIVRTYPECKTVSILLYNIMLAQEHTKNLAIAQGII